MTWMHRTLLLFLTASATLAAANQTGIDVNADTPWTDTGLDLNPGDDLTFTATGSVSFLGALSSPILWLASLRLTRHPMWVEVTIAAAAISKRWRLLRSSSP